MSTGGSRVSIPESVRKTIQDIREVAGKHSDDDIYAVLKECNMDPDETAQRLMYLDTFHEVKSKRDRRKVNINASLSKESRWIGTKGRGVRDGQGNYSSYIPNGAGAGRKLSVPKENGVSTRMERDFKPSLPVLEQTGNSANPHATNSSTIPVKWPTILSASSLSNERGRQSSAGVDSTLDSEAVPPPSSQVPGVDAIKCETKSQRIAAEAGAVSPARNGSSTVNDVANIIIQAVSVDVNSSVQKEAQIVEKNHPLNTFEISSQTASCGSTEAVSIQDGRSSQQLNSPSKGPTLEVEAGFQSYPEPEVSSLEKAISDLDRKLEKLNIPAHQPVIFPNHLQVPEDVKVGLTFGSLGASFDQGVEYGNGLDNKKGSMAATQSLVGNEKAAGETYESSTVMPSSAEQGDFPKDPHPPPLMPDNLSPLKDSVMSGAAVENDQSKQDIILPQGGLQYPFVHTAPNYGFPFIPQMLGGHFVPFEGLEHQSGNSLDSSTSGSTSTTTQPAGVGQSTLALSPPPFPVLQQPYPPNYFPFSPYFPPFYLASNAQHFLRPSAFPQQPSTSNLYLSPSLPPAAAGPGVKYTVPQSKPGHDVGNLAQFGFPSGYGSYSPSLSLTSGRSAGNEDLAASMLKDNSAYTTVQQADGSLVRTSASGRDMSILHPSSFYNHIPEGQHLAFTHPQVGHTPFAGAYHPAQTMAAATSTARPLLQQSQARAGSVEPVGPQSGAYQQQPHHPLTWSANY